jgi:CubicO group peptidase (beta-lactamase class C family)
MRVFITFVVLILLTLVMFWAIRIGNAVWVATGLAAKSVCSAAFVSGLDGDATLSETVKPMISVAGPFVSVTTDRARGETHASAMGIFAQRAEHIPGYGCRLVMAGTEPLAPATPPAPVSKGAAFNNANPELRGALDTLFTEPAGETPRRIKAVVVVRDGRIIAERYATGYGPDTPLPSFSIAKSVTNALIGILAKDGKLDIDAPAPIDAWRKAGGFAATVTPHHLMQMASGTEMTESGSGFDASSRMVYAQRDMAAYAIGGRISEAPGTRWNYTSTNTVILASIVRRIVGGGPREYAGFAQARLFAPLGMRNVTLEFDGAGTQEASASMLATARDWARFGQLYVADGVAPGGERLFPEGWVSMSRKSTLGTTYGAGFWTNDGPSVEAANRVRQGMPKDAFFASGNLGQRIYILPSAKTVIARFGVTHRPPDFAIQADLAFMRAVLNAQANDGLAL